MTARSHLRSSGSFGASVLIFATLVFSSQPALAQPTLPKLWPGGTVGAANAGFAVALSAVGDTAMVGGWGDNSNVGAVWVFTRSGGVWTQQGSKLVSPGRGRTRLPGLLGCTVRRRQHRHRGRGQ